MKPYHTHHHTATCWKKQLVTCRFNTPWSLSMKIVIACKIGQRKHQISSFAQIFYKDILNRIFSILLQENNNVDLTETDLLCKVQVLSEKFKKK